LWAENGGLSLDEFLSDFAEDLIIVLPRLVNKVVQSIIKVFCPVDLKFSDAHFLKEFVRANLVPDLLPAIRCDAGIHSLDKSDIVFGVCCVFYGQRGMVEMTAGEEALGARARVIAAEEDKIASFDLIEELAL